ncbi:hypothetical protein C3432_09160 [Citrobacter amalonaticus]|uniref:Uncharacterized protein n=1 Tax=Citrobacter amalonaticus TaxID=35703 RepID=A0A2S4RZJ6_CITAM|nr:hypothetical protein [Citrobacter amalonaticus]POT58080.1 hypothetical protein C3432_09160 [Citrobacter amalonaticus]POT76395.1 hypothetical protein C3436_02665 [Citrobacter amalonaticus]POU66606.1 hypothetical protein C3430_07360 [Citrobacter amalonaticus]POV05630.1 hypothetical protein C3424_09970 [Citrobacter amalonaticus]
MPVSYTDGAKTFIGLIVLGAVGLMTLLAFLFVAPEKKMSAELTPPVMKTYSCRDDEYIGYADNDDIGERINNLVEQKKFDLYCLEQTGVRRWSIYGHYEKER